MMNTDEDEGICRERSFRLQCIMENRNKEYCLTQGEAGKIIISGENIVVKQPDYNEMEWVEARRVESRRYENNALGYGMKRGTKP